VSKRKKERGSYISTILGIRGIEITTVKLAAKDKNLIELIHYHSHPGKKPAKNEINDAGISHIAFTVKDVDAEYKRMSAAHVRFNSLPQFSSDGYAKVVFCRDFEGNLIELVQVL
jgi:catechol 2,3-dioxygenase-like lactoylglutathione lyase family enzyme